MRGSPTPGLAHKLGGGEALVPTGAGVVVLELLRHVLLARREVCKILLALNHRFVWGIEGQLFHTIPIEALEPLVALKVGNTTRAHGESLAGLVLQQIFDEIADGALALRWEGDLANALRDLRVDLHGVCRLEGRMAGHQLEGQNAQGPPIHGVRVACRGNQLGGEVVRSATCCVSLADHELGQTHVRQLDVALIGQEQILRLEIAVDDTSLVQVLKRVDGACNVVLCMLFAAVEALSVVSCVQFSTKRRLHEEVEGLGAIVSFPELNDKVRICHHQDVLLVHHAVLHAGLDNIALTQALHGVGVVSSLVLIQLDSSEATASQQTDALQVLPENLLALSTSHGSWQGLVALGHARSVHILARSLNDVLQRTQQQVE
mmetsp:Transcript_47317/g.101326  ORF Transcript_47317/g.101326 Transcript_47317/m.101326 type:complete len:376 (-) Transcript_47317:1517-2644(-)